MAFQIVPKMHDQPHAKLVNTVRFMRNGNTAMVMIARDLAVNLGERVEIAVGVGEHAGHILISPASGATKPRIMRPCKGGVSPQLLVPKALLDQRPDAPVTVPHTMTPDGLVLDLRPYLKRTKTSAFPIAA